MAKASELKVQEIDLDLIDEPAGIVRLEIDPGEIQELADNITQIGLLQPIVVRPDGERFEIVDGHRRYLSFKSLARKKIPCIVRDLDDVTVAVSRASANLRVVGLSLIEEAAIYADLRDTHGLTGDQIGKLTGISPNLVNRRIGLLKMPPQLQKAIHAKQISFRVAEDLWSLGDIGAIDYYLGFAIDHGATSAVVRAWVKDWKDRKRRAESAGDGGGGVRSPIEPRPVWVNCDLCQGPIELGKETALRCCSKCVETAKKALLTAGE